MADEPTKVETPPAAETPVINEDKLAASIAKGVAESIKAARQSDAPQEAAVTNPPVAALPPLPQGPSDDDIDAAIEAGDKTRARDLRKQQRLAEQARLNREVDQKIAPGLHAINQLSENEVKGDPYFKRYEKEIRSLIGQLPQGTLVTGEHWRHALNMVKGNHTDEIAEERYEERVRAAREQAAAPAPAGRGTLAAPAEPEMETLEDAFGAGFKQRLDMKKRAVGGRSDDEEVRLFDAHFRSKMPRNFMALDEKGQPTKFAKIETAKGYIAEALEIQKIAEEDPSLGLGS